MRLGKESSERSIYEDPARGPVEGVATQAGLSATDASIDGATAREKAADRVVEAKKALDDAKRLEAEANAADRASQAQAARDRAAQFLTEHRYSEAKKALDEAEKCEEEAVGASLPAQAQAVRERAVQLMAEKRYAEAKKALEEADELESGKSNWKTGPKRAFGALRSHLPSFKSSRSTSAPEVDGAVVPATAAVEESNRVIGLYSKIAAVAGLLPGGLLNFGAILIVQVVMVWRISRIFGHTEGKERIRGSILSLFGSVLPTGIGHGAGMAISAIPALITGTLVYFLVTPVLAYAMTKAVGNVFVMHFESGGTLLTFDSKAFGEYFVQEFQKAGGTVSHTPPAGPTVAQTA